MFLGYIDQVKHRDELGGHSSVFALIAQKEECQVFIAAQPSDFNKREIPLKGKYHNLIWPSSRLT